MLPLMFGLIAAASLLFALGFLWRSLKLALAETKSEVPGAGWVNHDRARLLDEKRVVLQGIRELKDDLEAGKIAQDDFDRVHRALKAQGVRVLRDLDAPVAPYLEEVESLVTRHLEEQGLARVESGDAKGKADPADEAEAPSDAPGEGLEPADEPETSGSGDPSASETKDVDAAKEDEEAES